MKRVLIFSAVAAAAVGLSAAPAVAGLAGNASFSHQIPVRVPSGATAAQIADDHGHDAVDNDNDSTTPTPTATSVTPTATPTDRDERHGSPAPSATTEPGDDRGHDTTSADPTPSASDENHRGSPTSSASSQPGDGRGSSTSSDENHRGRDGSGRGDGGSDG